VQQGVYEQRDLGLAASEGEEHGLGQQAAYKQQDVGLAASEEQQGLELTALGLASYEDDPDELGQMLDEQGQKSGQTLDEPGQKSAQVSDAAWHLRKDNCNTCNT